MDLIEDCASPSDSQSSSSNHSNSNSNGNSNSNINNNGEVKKCSDCQTTTTPLWRGGPAGPKTLCNACGIKFHKKRRALLGINKQQKDDSNKLKKKTIIKNNNDNNNNIGMPLKIKVMQSGIRKSGTNNKFGEVEQAALLLMALSYGSVYA
ncbi:GATA transcription factor 16-like [Silene latifolia]|uniref:GATA transcription factor 16-like n=1 Tax=Silene latifolia TaxID=37657 RepID=UPI003D77CA87